MPPPTQPPGGSPYGLLAGIGGVTPQPAPQQDPQPGPAAADSRRPRLLPVAAVLLVTGLLLSVALTSTRRSAPELTRQRTAIEAQIAARTKEVDGLNTARQRLRVQTSQARSTAATAGPQAAAARATVARLGALTGAASVTGPGLRVRLADPTGSGARAYRIADRDLAQVVNALWAAGAEAVAINDARLTARSAIRSAGDAVLVNLRPLASPYRLEAIGPSDALAASFANSPIAARLRTAAAVYGSSLSVQVPDELRLPAATGLAVPIATPSGTPSASSEASSAAGKGVS